MRPQPAHLWQRLEPGPDSDAEKLLVRITHDAEHAGGGWEVGQSYADQLGEGCWIHRRPDAPEAPDRSGQ